MGGTRHERAKQWLLRLASLRTVAALVALPLAPFLFRHSFLVLVLLRPSAAVILAGGYLARHGHVALPAVVAAALPMQVLAVWLYFALGRAWSNDIDRDDRLPFLVARVLRPAQVRELRRGLRDRGPVLVFLTRFAVFPAGLTAAAAGSSGLEPRSYLPADAAAAVVSTLAAIGCGYGLGIAHDAAGPWLVAVGVAGLCAVTAMVTVFVRRGLPEEDS